MDLFKNVFSKDYVSEEHLEFKVFILLRNTKHYNRMRGMQGEVGDTYNDEIINGFTFAFSDIEDGDYAKLVSVPVNSDAVKNVAANLGIGTETGDGETPGEDFLNELKKIPVFAENMPTVGQLGFPLYIPNVDSVSRNLRINGAGSASFTITDLLDRSATPNDVYLFDLLKKVSRFKRNRYSFSKSSTSEATEEGSETTPSGEEGSSATSSELIDALKTLYGPFFGDEETIANEEGEENTILHYYFKALLNMTSTSEPGERYFNVLYPNREEIIKDGTGSTLVSDFLDMFGQGDNDSTKEILTDYIEYFYDILFEDMTPVWIFAVRPPLSPADKPRWTPYFHGFINGFSYNISSDNNTIDLSVDCLCPLGILQLIQVKSSYVMLDWVNNLSKTGDARYAIADAAKNAQTYGESLFSSYFYQNYWVNSPHYKVLEHLISTTSATMTFLGLCSYARNISDGSREASEYDGIIKLQGQTTDTQLDMVPQEYFRMDYIYMPTSDYGDSILALKSDKAGVRTYSDIRKNVDTYQSNIISDIESSEAEEGREYDAERLVEDEIYNKLESPWLWAYDGNDLVTTYWDDYPRKVLGNGEVVDEDPLKTDLESLQYELNPIALMLKWWVNLGSDSNGKIYSGREKFLPKVMIDATLYQDSIFALQFRDNFRLDAQEENQTPLNVLSSFAERLGALFFSDAAGNLCFISERYDDHPMIFTTNDGQPTTMFLGWSPFSQVTDMINDLEGEDPESLKEGATKTIVRRWGTLADHDNRYVISSDFLVSEQFNTDTSQIVTAAMASSSTDFMSFDGVLGLLANTGASTSDLYTQTKYGYRYQGMHDGAVVQKQSGLPLNLQGEQMQRFTDALIRRNNLSVTNGNVKLEYQTLLMQLGRNAILPDVQKKGMIVGINDSISKEGGFDGSITLDPVTGIEQILGSPYLEYMIQNPEWRNDLSQIEYIANTTDGVQVGQFIYDVPEYPDVVQSNDGILISHGSEMLPYADDLVAVTGIATSHPALLADKDSSLRDFYLRSSAFTALQDAISYIESVWGSTPSVTITSTLRATGCSVGDPSNPLDVNGIRDSHDTRGHWSGFAIDYDIWNMCGVESGDITALEANAYYQVFKSGMLEYGFTVPFNNEPWHFRYTL